MRVRRVSIVIACYNGERFLVKQLDSIQKQTRKPDEIIFLDDCSVDKTREIIINFIQNTEVECRLIEHDMNRGYRSSFYEGILHATGDVIFCCDQDDIWDDEKIEKLVQIFNSRHDVKVINTNYLLIDDMDQVIVEKGLYARNIQYNKSNNLTHIRLEDILKFNTAMGCTMAFHKDIKDEIQNNFDLIVNLNIPHDWVINIIGGCLNCTYYFKEKMIRYRIHKDNTIGLNREKSYLKRIEKLNNSLEEHLEMKKILDLYKMQNSGFIDNLIHAYVIRIGCFKENNIKKYIIELVKGNILKYASIKSVGLDLLILSEKRKNI